VNSPATAENLHVHLPTPGDHYSPATGSALMTIIYELAREHQKRDGDSRIIVGRGTRHDYPVGTAVEVDYGALPSRRMKLADAAMGRVGLPRHFSVSLYKPARQAIERNLRGSIFLHNNPAFLPMLKRRCEAARVCLYLNNVVFRTYARREIRRILDACDAAICVSDFIADDLAFRAGGSSDKLVVVHNGVDTARFKPADPCPDGDPVVLFLGRVIPEKGPDLLLRAARKVVASGARPFKIRIVGSSGFSVTDALSPYEIELRRLAEPIRELVEFRPFADRAAIISEYGVASIFCAPSNWDDPCPLTVLEGLACGLPTIASRRGGIPEIGGDAAMYFRPPDVDELAQQLSHLLDDERARAEWGARARARAETFSWSNQYGTLSAALDTARMAR